MRQSLAAVAVVALVVLAGCSGGLTDGLPTTNGQDDANDSGGAEETASDSGSSSAGPGGTVNFYISDDPNALEDFEYLNVTVTVVSFERANGENESEEEADEGEEEGEREDEAGDNETETETLTAESENAVVETAAASNADRAQPEPRDRPGWVTREVENVTVDLTQLEGANATLIDQLSVPDGEYRKVAIWIGEIDGRLESGEQANVRLPSGRLQIQTAFTVGNNESVDFVFDITVVRAGNSGFYNIQPVVSESGPDQEINEVGPRGPDGERGNDREDDEEDDSDEYDEDENEERDEDDGEEGDGQGNGNGPDDGEGNSLAPLGLGAR